jgi:hypothetical protein
MQGDVGTELFLIMEGAAEVSELTAARWAGKHLYRQQYSQEGCANSTVCQHASPLVPVPDHSFACYRTGRPSSFIRPPSTIAEDDDGEAAAAAAAAEGSGAAAPASASASAEAGDGLVERVLTRMYPGSCFGEMALVFIQSHQQ